jgi:hypothetical protein
MMDSRSYEWLMENILDKNQKNIGKSFKYLTVMDKGKEKHLNQIPGILINTLKMKARFRNA